MANYFIDAGSVTGIFLIAGLGIYILTGLCGQISLTQATYMGLGGIISAYLSRSVVHEQGYLVGRDGRLLSRFSLLLPSWDYSQHF